MGYYNDIYKKIKKWHFVHADPKTDADWKQIVDSLKEFTEPLEIDLVVSVVNEIERTYNELKTNKCK